jgi:hypothetical protein
VVELRADIRFAMEAFKKDGIALHLGVRDFDGYRASRAGVDSPVNGGHAAAGYELFDVIVIELIANVDWIHAVIKGQQNVLGGA